MKRTKKSPKTAAKKSATKPAKSGEKLRQAARAEISERLNALEAPTKMVKPAKEKRVSALDAAAQVLAEANEPMGAKDLIASMANRGLWISPGGKTPHATLYAAIVREINSKGDASRFTKTDRGQFASARS